MLTKYQEKQLKIKLVNHFYEFLWNARQFEWYYEWARDRETWTSSTRKIHTENACKFLVKAHINYQMYSEVFDVLTLFDKYDYTEELEEQAKNTAYMAELLKWYRENKKRSLIIRNLARKQYYKATSYKRM